MKNRIESPDLLRQVRIRPVLESDLFGMEWDGEYSHYRRMYAEAYERSRRGRSILWVVDLPQVGLIGQAFIQLICDRPELADGATRAYVYGFRIRQPYRSQGLGTHLLIHLENDLRKRRYRWVTLNVARDNPRARQLYERNGYRVVAPEPGVWSFQDEKGSWHTIQEPAWRMEKDLG